MATKINATSRLFIALVPDGADENAKQLSEICLSTECVFNKSMNKTDKTYFCNGGETTAIITGSTSSLTVSIDFDITKPAHKYLYSLMTSSDFTKCNGQYIKIQYPLFEGEATPASVEGLCCIQFKNDIPSGAPNELIKISFDIFPQDSPWTRTAATTN